MSDLTLEEKATNHETFRHIEKVRNLLGSMVIQLLARAALHDQSKLEPPEVSMFTEFTPKLAKSTYGSPEYEGFRKAMGPALAHHYAKNRHHPEHFKDGIDDMNLVDLVEMLCDWSAAASRHENGDLKKSIEINQSRFNISPQLKCILLNTVSLVNGEKQQWEGND